MMSIGFVNINLFFMILIGVFGLIILMIIASKIYEHAQSNNIPMPLLWVLLVITMPILGLLIYLLVASTYSQQQSNLYQRQAATVDAAANGASFRTTATINPSSPIPGIRANNLNTNKTANLGVPSASETKNQFNNSKFCPSCGSKVNIDYVFCSYCGAKL